jgi:hypothetical protein
MYLFTYAFMCSDLELASMHSILIWDTPSHDGQQCYQVSSISIKAFKSYGPDTICTDRRTDGKTDSNAENRWQTVDIDELDFVAAVYDGKWYLGKVITIDDEDDEAKINFMEQCPGKIVGIYRWPNPPDELWVSLSDILKRIPEPLNFGFLCRTY